MSAGINYMGRSYDESTNWLEVLREAARKPLGPSWLRSDIDVASGLADLAQALSGSAAYDAIAEAALTIAENGTEAERAVTWQLPFERGHNAVKRLLDLIDKDRNRLEALHGVPNVLWRLLQVDSHDANVLAALKREAAAATADPWLVDLAAQYLRPAAIP